MRTNDRIALDFYTEVREAGIKIQLTGSRYFKGYGNDWDFFIPAEEEHSMGLKPILKKYFLCKEGWEDSPYTDKYTSGVYRSTLGIDLQLCLQYRAKVMVQEAIINYGMAPYMPEGKSAQRHYWNMLMSLVVGTK